MNADRWQTVDRIFIEALQLPPGAREALVARECGTDADLREDVLSLLNASDSSGEFLEKPALERLATAMAADGWSLRPGERVGAYTVRELLGTGAVGEVWRATDERLNRDVAIKVLLPHLSSSAERIRHFTEEARTAGSLNHPNILSVHDVGEQGGAPFIVSEYVQGETLRGRLTRGVLPIEMAISVAIQLARGLAAAHGRGIIHRDLKPENVFLRSDGGVKILDFGLAKLSAPDVGAAFRRPDNSPQDATISSIAGTAGYTAPEQIRGEEADARSDLFALGVTLYEMFAGQRPFKGNSAVETLNATLSADPAELRRLRSDVPPSLARIVLRLLEKTPQARFQSADELLQALEDASGPGASRTSALSPRLIGAAALLLLTLIAGGIVAWRPPHSSRPIALGASGRPAIAVLSFDNTSRSEDAAWLTTGVPSMLLTGLAQTPGLDIVSAQRVHEALVQAGHSDMASLDRRESAEVARRAGAGAIVVGAIYKSGDNIRIDAQVEDLASGRVLAADTVSGTDVFALADALATRIRTGIGFGDSVDLRRITDVSSTSIAAYRLYARGLDASVNLRWTEAVRFLEQAIAIDPGFAEAHLRLAPAYGGLGQPAAADRALRTAFAHADRLSERHRLLLAVQLESDAATKARLLDDLLARFPDIEEAYLLAAQLYDPVAGALPNARKQLAVIRAGVEVLPASGQVRNAYGYTLLTAGRFAEAAREFEKYAQLAPLEPNPFDSLGDAYVLLGAPEKAVEAYSRAVELDRTFASNGLAYALGMLGRYEEALAAEPTLAQIRALLLSRVGRYAEAERHLRRGIERAEADKNVLVAGGLHQISASLALERRDFPHVLRQVRAVRQRRSGMPVGVAKNTAFIIETLAGLADLGLGRIAQAQTLADRQVRTHRASNPVDRLWRGILKAELALAHRDAATATAAFSAGELPQRGVSLGMPGSVLTNNLILRDVPARAALVRGDTKDAIRIYRRLLANGPEVKWVSLYEPRYVFQLARLLEATGDQRGAQAEYGRFLQLWKDADADLPELAEARRALDRLEGN
jgi:serine/threonine protein kinase/tetratricopeptide (TPR) repeat protein